MMKSIVKLAGTILFLAAGWQAYGPAYGQTWDTSGNGLLRGTSYFREVFWFVGDNTGTLNEAIAVYGGITFDGNGNYTITNAQVFDGAVGRAQNFSIAGTYSISASGYGFLANPL